MYRQHEYTHKRQTNQPSLYSLLSRKLCFKSPKTQEHEEKALSSSAPAPGPEKGRADERERREVRSELKCVVRRLIRITPFLSEAYLSQYASEKGKKGCETCSWNKEMYKSNMNSIIKVVEVIVDDVISKEQKEILNKEDEKQGTNKPRAKDKSKDEKKISIKFEVYSQKNIHHNLKCVLIQLQNIIGDTLLQVCYCKMKKAPRDKQCKQYNLSLIDLEQLKFEYSNLTNKIIFLFKTTSGKQTNSFHKCVNCIKEEITEYIKILENMLENGRNLKVTMRNENTREKCCSRNTPHVHATVQGRPLVLKYELPFEVTQHPPKPNRSLKRESPQFDEECSNDVSFIENVAPYDKWPKHFAPEPVKEVDKDTFIAESPSILSNESVKSSKKYTSLVSDLSEKQSPSNITLSLKSSDSSVVTPPLSRISKARSSVPSDNLCYSPYSKSKSSISKTKNREDTDSERYCSCNFNLVYEKLNVKKYTSTDTEQLEKTPSRLIESDSYFSLDESDSDSIPRKLKKVSFIPEGKHTVLYVRDTPPESVFTNVFENHDHPPKRSKSEKVRGKPLSHVNSVALLKNKNSLSENSTIKDCEQSNIAEKSFIVPQYEIKQSLTTGSKITDQKIVSSTSLNKQQVNEVMKDLGATKLLSVSLPAECCKDNKNLTNFKCTSDLPFSASLHSLPLDQDDLNHITRVVEKLISSEDIVLDPDFDKQWEIQYIEEPEDIKNEPEFHKSLMARDNASNICIEIQSEKTLTKKNLAKNLQKDVINLPTINEEKTSSDEKQISQSLPEDKKVNKDFINKNQISSEFRIMELRYLTIEYPNENKIETPKQTQRCGEVKSNIHNLKQVSSIIDKGFRCDDYLNFCGPVIKTTNKLKKQNKIDQLLKWCRCNKNKNPNSSPIEEMIMLDIIYLTSDTKNNNVFIAMNPSNNILKSCGDNIKLSKPISSCEFFKENNIFETEEIITKNTSNMQIKNSEANEDFTNEIEQTFQASSNLIGSCEIPESIKEMLCKKTYFETGYCKKREILNSRKQTSLRSSGCLNLNIFSSIQDLPDANKKGQRFLKPSNFDWNIIPVQKCKSLNHRNYFIFRKSRINIVKHLNPIKSGATYKLKQFTRKPSVLNNTAIGFKLVRCKISTPVLPKNIKIALNYETPQLLISPKNQKLINVVEYSGLVKNYFHELESEHCQSNPQCLSKSPILKENIHNTLINTSVSIDLNKSDNLPSNMSNFVTNPLANDKKEHSCSCDYLGSYFYLYDVNDQSMTDTSEGPNRSLSYDLNIYPIVYSPEENDFNTLEPRFSESLKVHDSDLDKGQPLTSTSGTLLNDFNLTFIL